MSWGYTTSNGPSCWKKFAPAASGQQQSPIDIEPSKVSFDEKLKENPLKIDFNCCSADNIINNGASCQVGITCNGKSLSGGPLTKKFSAAQFHLHWGSTDSKGSEHTVNGKQYAAELHIVHYNSDVYDSAGDAVPNSDGLCVLGILIKAGDENKRLNELTSKLKGIRHKEQTASMAGFDISSLLPEDTSDYWTYHGSLTTPPCLESVTWIVFREPIEVSPEQLEEFRQLLCYKEGDEVPACDHIVDNFRPTLALNNRTVSASFSE